MIVYKTIKHIKTYTHYKNKQKQTHKPYKTQTNKYKTYITTQTRTKKHRYGTICETIMKVENESQQVYQTSDEQCSIHVTSKTKKNKNSEREVPCIWNMRPENAISSNMRNFRIFISCLIFAFLLIMLMSC